MSEREKIYKSLLVHTSRIKMSVKEDKSFCLSQRTGGRIFRCGLFNSTPTTSLHLDLHTAQGSELTRSSVLGEGKDEREEIRNLNKCQKKFVK